MRRFIKFFKNTTVRLISVLLAVIFVASLFLYKSFYKEQVHKVAGFYYVHQGDNYYKKSQPQKAIESYQKALKYYPGHWRARYNLANIYVAYEDFYLASDSYKKALEIKPDFQIARIDHGIILAETLFNYDMAIEEYKKAIELKPRPMYIPFIVNNKYTSKYNKGVAYYNLGLAWRGKSLLAGNNNFASRKYLENAIEAYNSSLKIQKSYNTYYNLAIAHHLVKNPKEAGLNYCNAIQMEPLSYEAHYNLAILLRSLKNYRASIDEFKKAGLILDVRGDAKKTSYIYDALNEASKSLVRSGDYQYLVERLDDDSQIKDGQITYVNGKVVITRELDRAMAANFKNCKSKSFFEGLTDSHERPAKRPWGVKIGDAGPGMPDSRGQQEQD